jgi:hypothetical protein
LYLESSGQSIFGGGGIAFCSRWRCFIWLSNCGIGRRISLMIIGGTKEFVLEYIIAKKNIRMNILDDLKMQYKLGVV